MSTLVYDVRFTQPQTHCYQVSLSFRATGGAVELTLPAWIPGSYMIRDFARNILSLSATVDGGALRPERVDKQTWRLPACRGEIRVGYEVYAHDLSVRGAHLDDTHAYFNGTSLFLRVVGREASPHEVTLRRPAGDAYANWRVATTLPVAATDDAGFGRYAAPDYETLIDHPVEIADLGEIAFDVEGVPHRLAFYGRQDADLARIAGDLAPVCGTHGKLFGGPPPMSRYLFMVTAVGDGYGGLEHRDCTSLICSRGDLPRPGDEGISEGYRRFLGLCSHEYFHLWNVKRIRPARFAEADLSSEAYSELLWAFEGITSYYDDLALARSGVIDADSYLALLAQSITRLMKSGGRHRQSVAESSFYAWTKFYKQDENAPNAVVSYYVKGALVALGLDVTLRLRTEDEKSLDDLMRALWQRHGLQDVPVPEEGIERLAREICGGDLGGFFAAWVHGMDELPLTEWLADLGLGMRLRAGDGDKDKGGVADPGKIPAAAKPVLGATFTSDPAGVRLSSVLDGGAAQAAGLSPGDLIVAFDGLKVGADNLAARIAAVPEGSSVEVHAFRRDELRSCRVAPALAPADTCDLWLLPDDEMDSATRARRALWLGRAAGAGAGDD